jgi:hypothetical protein
MTTETKKNFWFYVKEIGKFTLSTALTFLPEIIGATTPEYTVLGKIGGFAGYAWQMYGFRDKYVKDVLPQYIGKVMDSIPNSITGVRGSKSDNLPSGLR